MKKIQFLFCLLFSILLFSQTFEKKVKYLDSIVSKSDTIFILFTKEINFAQSEVPIYNHQIETEKLKYYGKIKFDTLKDGRLIYQNLPGQFDRNYTADSLQIKQSLIFEDNFFKTYNQPSFKQNNKIIGYEKRICLNNDNRISQDFCSAESFYKYIFYHSYIKAEYQKKYQNYIHNRNMKLKQNDIKYSGRSPIVESGAVNFMGIKTYSIDKRNLLFFVDSFYENIKGTQNRRIIIPYLDAILKPNKVYFLKTNHTNDSNEDIFEEVKYQKYVSH